MSPRPTVRCNASTAPLKRRRRTGAALRRGGVTLVELLLVMAILVMVAAAAAPSLRGTLRDQQLKRAADQVRIEWARAHVQAMKTGRIQVFRYEMGGQAFRVEPWLADNSLLEADATTASQYNPLMPLAGPNPNQPGSPASGQNIASAAANEAELAKYRLPEEINFVAGDAMGETRALEVEQAILDSERTVEWSRPILFYPDGATSDAFVIVGGPRETGILVELRGLTGTTVVSDIRALNELAPTGGN